MYHPVFYLFAIIWIPFVSSQNEVCPNNLEKNGLPFWLSDVIHGTEPNSNFFSPNFTMPLTFKQMIMSIDPDTDCSSRCCQELVSLRDDRGRDPTQLRKLLQFYDASATYRSASRSSAYLSTEGTYSLCKRAGGNYCRINKHVPPFNLIKRYDVTSFHCVPASCGVDEMNAIIANFPDQMPINVDRRGHKKTYDYCYDIEKYYSTYTWWEIVAYSVLLLWFLILMFIPNKAIKVGPTLARLTDMSVDPAKLNTLNSFRILSLMCVVTGHIFLYYGVRAGAKVYQYFPKKYALQNPIKATFGYIGISLSVDGFFVISGFLSGYLLAKRYGRNQQVITWVSAALVILKRLLRFIPPIGAAIMLTQLFFAKPTAQTATNRGYLAWDRPSTTTGTIGLGGPEDLAENCRQYWYLPLFLVYFLSDGDETKYCLEQLWYLSTDFWIGFIVIFVIYFYFKSCSGDITSKSDWKNVGFYLGLALMGMTLAFNIIRGFLLQDEFGKWRQFEKHAKYPSNITTGFWSDNYLTPWYRLGPYLVGCYFGILLLRHETLGKTEKYSTIRIKLALSGIGIGFSIFYALPHIYTLFYPRWLAILLTATYRNIFGVCFSYLIYNLEKAKQGWAYKIFSSPKFYFLSRINFSTYICHWLSQTLVIGRFFREVPFWTDQYLLSFTLSMIFHSYCLGLFFFICFENPLNYAAELLLAKVVRYVK